MAVRFLELLFKKSNPLVICVLKTLEKEQYHIVSYLGITSRGKKTNGKFTISHNVKTYEKCCFFFAYLQQQPLKRPAYFIKNHKTQKKKDKTTNSIAKALKKRWIERKITTTGVTTSTQEKINKFFFLKKDVNSKQINKRKIAKSQTITMFSVSYFS
ncbi:hypothetical protein RFI_14144 [Reticulomyxa filosa]|uniref:Uncharacterized protein n=1 Tax=Reticulomyxa filosa TaxID=46433 RepID=X6NCJ3_RETFI|nr:hypothetical protein RFI_14144 [Reticulomyxa filosa]|eukprot:ETO23042.1 hypothetical protein RFI_14144 [Reticulomyxa filosa]